MIKFDIRWVFILIIIVLFIVDLKLALTLNDINRDKSCQESCNNYCTGEDTISVGVCKNGECNHYPQNCSFQCADNECISVMAIYFRIETVKYYPDKKYVNAVIRNLGAGNLSTDMISIYIDGSLQENYTFSKPFIDEGEFMVINITNVTTSCSGSILKVVLKIGMTDTNSISCS